MHLRLRDKHLRHLRITDTAGTAHQILGLAVVPRPFTRPPSTRRRRTRGLRRTRTWHCRPGTAPAPSAWGVGLVLQDPSTTRPVDVRSRIGGLRLLSSLIGTVDLSVSRAVRCQHRAAISFPGFEPETYFDSGDHASAGPTPGRRPTSRLHDVQARTPGRSGHCSPTPTAHGSLLASFSAVSLRCSAIRVFATSELNAFTFVLGVLVEPDQRGNNTRTTSICPPIRSRSTSDTR